jgi:hypothetical protein
MHYLVSSGQTKESDLKLLFGSRTAQSLDKLQRSEMIFLRGNFWQARPLSKVFAIRRIIAIEAKVDSWRNALDQAFINTWFTSESYVLVPSVPKGATLLDSAIERGIGVLSKENPYLLPQPPMKPRSYASWLFNEWTWRLATL